ncbi:transcriptional regulator [Pedobacter sp. KBW06]|uniref:helix-turn-helix transcriptional regulator n=1 Tax=Pedobacter sp. KBW06 TaxID=2153359 RepID=UPI000F5A14BC|nr:helix-turn-helix domain-containing protein [Pedobacter sp. KBW06]RQO66503.1 transcriptional regulator [Pedobacter sp. KBW06]
MKNRIRLYRKEKGFTQLRFAKILQLTPYKFRSLENGKVLPSQELAIKIAQLLEVSIDEAFFIEENRR